MRGRFHIDKCEPCNGTGLNWPEEATRNTEEYYGFQPGQKVIDRYPSVTDEP
jgi:hypothetical protein